MSLFVGSCPDDMRQRDLEDAFDKFGRCRVAMKRGFAFVDFEDTRDAEDALRDLRVSMS